MITNIELDHDQICALLAEACGATPESVVVTPLSTNEGSAVTASIGTDLKGAQRVERVLKKMAKAPKPAA